jgi:hypothetical protein
LSAVTVRQQSYLIAKRVEKLASSFIIGVALVFCPRGIDAAFPVTNALQI